MNILSTVLILPIKMGSFKKWHPLLHYNTSSHITSVYTSVMTGCTVRVNKPEMAAKRCNLACCYRKSAPKNLKLSHYVLTIMPMKSQLKFLSQRNISVGSQQDSVSAFTLTTVVDWDLIKTWNGCIQLIRCSPSICEAFTSQTGVVWSWSCDFSC